MEAISACPHHPGDQLPQRARVEGLVDVRRHVRRERVQVAHRALGRQHEDRHRLRARVLEHARADGGAVQLGHHHVEDHQVGHGAAAVLRLEAQRVQGGAAVVGRLHDVAVLLEHELQHRRHVALVVDDQDARHGGILSNPQMG